MHMIATLAFPFPPLFIGEASFLCSPTGAGLICHSVAKYHMALVHPGPATHIGCSEAL